jgi:hypothetical protein
MSQYYGRLALRRCTGCTSIFSLDPGGGISHHCDLSSSICPECGIKHDAYSSHTTGVSPCLAALRFEINETLDRVRSLEAINHTLHRGLHITSSGGFKRLLTDE